MGFTDALTISLAGVRSAGDDSAQAFDLLKAVLHELGGCRAARNPCEP